MRGLRALALVLGLVPAGLPGAGAAAPQTVTPDAMRALGFQALTDGDARRALRFADALLERDAADPAALILRARAARELADYGQSRQAARAAWAAAETAAQRYGAALAMAQALASDGRRTEAQFWLRRAAEAAPSPAARAIAMRDFQYVRARNPLQIRLDFSVAPSSNVNNGSRHQFIELFGLPFLLSPDAQALSGGTASAGVSLRYRLAESQVSRTELRLAGSYRHVWLSASSRAAAPTAKGSDYSFAALEAGLSQRRRVGRGEISFGGTVGHNWYGGRDLSDYLRLDLGVEAPAAVEPGQFLHRAVLHGGVSVERQWRRDAPQRSADQISLTGGLAQPLASGDRLRLTAGWRHVSSRAADVSHQAVSARLGWDRAEPLPGGLRLSMGVAAEARDYGATAMAPQGRRDLRLEADLSVTFTRMDYLGFSPVLDLRATRSGSNVTLYDGRDYGVSLGFRSNF